MVMTEMSDIEFFQRFIGIGNNQQSGVLGTYPELLRAIDIKRTNPNIGQVKINFLKRKIVVNEK